MDFVAAKKISATKLAKKTAEILNRVEHKGERFVVERHGRGVAKIVPRKRPKNYLTGDELLDFLDELGPLGDEYARAVEEASARLAPLEPPF